MIGQLEGSHGQGNSRGSRLQFISHGEFLVDLAGRGLYNFCMNALSGLERERLLNASREAAQNSYSPYSHFRVGAAILCENEIHVGTNVENASLGLTLCAERAALASLISRSGKVSIRALAVSCIDAHASRPSQLMPCGACRQWLMELAPEAEIIVDMGLRKVSESMNCCLMDSV